MSTRYSQSFKIQAVEKALNRTSNTGMTELAESLGVHYSTLRKWIIKSKNQEFGFVPDNNRVSVSVMNKEKRPQDWSSEEKLEMVSSCISLDDEELSKACREQGLYPHHIKKWQQDFISGMKVNPKAKLSPETKNLRQENKALKKELNRKDKALAETAALLVLQKKVNAIWGNDGDNSQ